ncbi:MAG UNVERIFIED_CONTAM: septum formation initiator family protein [Rickettsiaceae bacterium]|jgi:cell division protein FtsB
MKRPRKFLITKRQVIHGLLASILLYFVFHSIYGNRGILTYFKISNQIEEKEKELDMIRAERLEIEHKVKALKPESLDADMLDEQARKNLGVVGVNEQAFVPQQLLEEETKSE